MGVKMRSSTRLGRVLGLCALLVAAMMPLASFAQYPARTVKIVVGYGPGGTMDTTGRLIAQGLQDRLGAPVIVENRPGASATIAGNYVAKSPADGYALFVTSVPPHATLPVLYKSLPYDPERDLQPVASILATQYVLVVHPSVPAATLPEFLEILRRESGKFEFASPGVGTASHLLSEIVGRTAGAQILHVPYKGSAAHLPDLFSGRVRMTFENLAVMVPHIKKGTVRALIVSGPSRSGLLPDVPTAREAGVPALEQVTAFGLFAPKGTPQAVVDRLNAEVNKIVETDAFAQRIAVFGALPLGGSRSRLAEFIEEEKRKWTPVIQELDLKME